MEELNSTDSKANLKDENSLDETINNTICELTKPSIWTIDELIVTKSNSNVPKIEDDPKWAYCLVDEEITPSPIIEKINKQFTSISAAKNNNNEAIEIKSKTETSVSTKVIFELESDSFQQETQLVKAEEYFVANKDCYQKKMAIIQNYFNSRRNESYEAIKKPGKFGYDSNCVPPVTVWPKFNCQNGQIQDSLNSNKILNENNDSCSNQGRLSESSIASFGEERFQSSSVKTLITVYRNTTCILTNDEETDTASEQSINVKRNDEKTDEQVLFENNYDKELRSILLSGNFNCSPQSKTNLRKRYVSNTPLSSSDNISEADNEYDIDSILNGYVESASSLYHRSSHRSLDKRRVVQKSLKLHKGSAGDATKQIKNFFNFLHDSFPHITPVTVQEVITEILNTGQGDGCCDNNDDRSFHSFESDEIAGSRVGDGRSNRGESDDNNNENVAGTNDIWQTSQVWRACYIPPKIKNLEIAPDMQTKPINFKECIPILNSLIDLVQVTFPVSTKLISRCPVLCPITSCNENIFISELPRHFNVNHLTIPMETISSRHGTNFFLEFKANRFGKNKCHLVYLVKNKVIELGNHKTYKNLYPIFVMSTIVHVTEILSRNWSNGQFSPTEFDKTVSKLPFYDEFYIPDCNKDHYVMLVWLTGLITKDLKVSATLTVWTGSGTVPVVHKTMSSQIYSIRCSQEPKHVYSSGNAMVLSSDEVKKLTNNERIGLQFQVFVH